MSSVCKATPAITSLAQISIPFPTSVFPGTPLQRNSDGRLTEGSLSSLYDSLVSTGNLVSLSQYKKRLQTITQADKEAQRATLESLGLTEKRTMDGIQAEFCYTYVRYKFALEDLFDTMSRNSARSALTPAQTTALQAKLDKAKELNTKLNDLIQLVNFIAKQRASEMREQNSDINSLNGEITSVYGQLAKANEILKKEDALTDLRKRMVEFTEEKNRSASNLLSLYGFLNLVALGLLFYIARS
jgi:septation ring formation regulator EzrA